MNNSPRRQQKSPRIAYYEGQEAYWDGTDCPYNKETQPECYEEWIKGWRSEDIRDQCRLDNQE